MKRSVALFAIVLWTALGLATAAPCAEIENHQQARDRFIAQAQGLLQGPVTLYTSSQKMTAPLALPAGKLTLRFDTGTGWIFAAFGKTVKNPVVHVGFVRDNAEVVLKTCKAIPNGLQKMPTPAAASFATDPVDTRQQAYERLVDSLLGHSTQGRRVWVYGTDLQGRLKVRNWKEELVFDSGPGWLFFVDDVPRANWEHSCRYVFVGRDGELDVRESTTPPDDMAPFEELTESPQPLSPQDFEAINAPQKTEGTVNALPGSAKDLSSPSATPAANRHAVIISGGYNTSNNHVRYWNDCSYFYKTLKNYGFLDDNIHVLISDGTDPAVDRSNDTNSPTDLDGDGDADTEYSATAANITTVFNELRDSLDGDDILYIFTTDHGGAGSDNPAPYESASAVLYLWGETMTDEEFAIEVNKVNTLATVAIFEQCFSGGMIDDLMASNRVIMSAARFWELSYSMSSGTYNEFSYYATKALDTPAAADSNGDGEVTMEEAYLYALANDSRQSESLSGGDNVGEHPSYYSNPWDLGRMLSLNGEIQTLVDPKYNGFTQHEISEYYSSSGSAQSWNGDDQYWEYTLPFSFPYGEQEYDKIYVSSNGVVFFENPSTSAVNSVDGLKQLKAVAPLWDDLTTFSSDGDDIYIDTDTYWVTIRWRAHTYIDDRQVSMAVKLSSSGAVRFLYGSGNNHTSRVSKRDKTIGVADGSSAHLCLRNGSGSLNDADSIEFRPKAESEVDVLYWSDQDLGNNAFPTAVTQLGYSQTTAESASDFEAKIASGEYEVAVLLLQNWFYETTHFPNFKSFLDSGGRAVFVDWTRDAGLGAWFGITYTGRYNETHMTLTDPYLINKVGNTSVDIYNPGWSYYSVCMALDGASSAATYDNGDVAIAYTDKTLINGPLKDTFVNFDLGVSLAKAELQKVLGRASVGCPAINCLLLP